LDGLKLTIYVVIFLYILSTPNS